MKEKREKGKMKRPKWAQNVINRERVGQERRVGRERLEAVE